MTTARTGAAFAALAVTTLALSACSFSVGTGSGSAASDGAVPFDRLQDATIQLEARGSFVSPEEGGYESAGRGSGVILSADGYALTNNHVVTGAGTLDVWRGGDQSTTLSARIVASSECMDLAVVKLDATDLPYVGFHAADAVVLARELGASYSEAEALMSTGTAWLRAGDAERAHDFLGRAIDVATTSGSRWCEASALWLDAKVSLAEHDDDRAVASLVRMIDACEEAADTTSTMVGLMTLAYALFRRGHVEDAAALRAVVDVRSESIGYWPAAMDPVDLGPYVAELTESIPADTAAAAVATARAAAEGRDGTSDLVEDILQRCR